MANISAAVVFLPELTTNFGQHGSDECFCEAMYGEVKPWGCKWFQLWRQHIEAAVSRSQRLQVFFFSGHCGAGKIASWAACATDAAKRDSFWPRRAAFLESLPPAEQASLEALPSEPYTSKTLPGTEMSLRWDEEQRLFMASLPEADRDFLEGHIGLGNSQKAEVAWLEKMGYEYEELDVSAFAPGPSR
jgi:hypothetical protein